MGGQIIQIPSPSPHCCPLSPHESQREPLSLSSSHVRAYFTFLCWLLFELISLSVWEPSAVCQAPYLSRMLMSIKYYEAWSLLRSLTLCISYIQIRSWLNALSCRSPSLLVNSIYCEPWWALSPF